MPHPWIADRTTAFDSSGIRKVFDLASTLTDPVNLSIGQPDFDVPEEVQLACIDAIQSQKNGYALTQGMPVLREKLQQEVDRQLGHDDRAVFVCSGTSGGLVLAMLSLVNPGDEVILFDPFFVMYPSLVKLVGGKPVMVDTYPDFRIDCNRVADAITPNTKLILLNSPANPTGFTASAEEIRQLAELALEKNIALVSDEIYSQFCYDSDFVSPAQFNDQTIVIDGFSKSHAMTGWRVGEAHWGGYSQKARVKADWLVPLPEGLDSRQAMAVGTAGFTAMLAVMALEDHGLTTGHGPVLVTGAAGGVGSVACAEAGGAAR